MRIAFVLPGLHDIVRGAEIAFENIAYEIAQHEDYEVTLFGSGIARKNSPYKFIHVNRWDRYNFESWPRFPIFRNEYIYEEFIFSLNFFPKYRPDDFDITVTCSYPFINWILRSKKGKRRPPHIFVTQNGDHPVITNQSEYTFFGCEGLICTNPEYFDRNKDQWFCKLITNGVDPNRFKPGRGNRNLFNLPENVPIVLMVSALINSKRTAEGVQAVAQMSGTHLVICGDGPERDNVKCIADKLMPGRLHIRNVKHNQIADMYRAADVFLHLSLDEPFGIVYLEALATGLPVVSHDQAVTRWILEETAILVDTNHISKIVDGLNQAFKCKDISNISSRLELVNRRFKWSKISHSYSQFFLETIKNSVDRKDNMV